MDIKFGIVALSKKELNGSVEQVSVLHFVGYTNQPTFIDFLDLYRELNTDPAFELDKKDYVLLPASPSMVEHYKELYVEEEEEEEVLQ